jgi:hypothetical protein
MLENNIYNPIPKNNEKIPVKVGITNHVFSDISPHDKTVMLNFEVYFIYPEEKILDNFKISENEKDDFRFPFHIQNSLDINTHNSWISYATCYNITENNIDYHKLDAIYKNEEIGMEIYGEDEIRPFQKPFKCKLEKHNIICELKIINFVELIPFNLVLVPIKIITNGCQGSNNIKFISESRDEIMWGVKVKSNTIANRWLPKGYILSTNIKTGKITDSAYSRIYFILCYKFSVFMDIIKYYFIPTILTIILTLFYNLGESDFAGLFSTIVLGDIALLFILPTTGEITKSEKSVCLNILMVIFITILKLYGVTITRLNGTLIFLFLNIINLIYDVREAHYKNKKILGIINNNGNLTSENNSEYLEFTSMGSITKRIDALDYVISNSSDSINTVKYLI